MISTAQPNNVAITAVCDRNTGFTPGALIVTYHQGVKTLLTPITKKYAKYGYYKLQICRGSIDLFTSA
ncbi:hypothetical protein [Dysgonomonas capnocytophagoides]|uniref:hypothetical protein n=1 Tax=Dysgonomonas capnocytophagoides TaxID=45254 RepID=UPI002A81CD62|nr:hypothetical protein [Dysgonomonas capnocytophagoides]